MSIIFTDHKIKAFIQERKVIPDNWFSEFKERMNRGFKEHYQDITGEDGNIFRIIVRKGDFSKSNFSVLLVVRIPDPKKYFQLCRYNGSNHQHSNDIEGEMITGFHIHTATERYQRKKNVFGYAQSTSRYSDVNGALQCLLEDANFEEPSGLQINLFEEV